MSENTDYIGQIVMIEKQLDEIRKKRPVSDAFRHRNRVLGYQSDFAHDIVQYGIRVVDIKREAMKKDDSELEKNSRELYQRIASEADKYGLNIDAEIIRQRFSPVY